jgi:glycosyltransferase involved in cell wall biosynthesis
MTHNKKNIYHFLLDHRLGGQHSYAETIIDEIEKTQKFNFKIITTKRGQNTDITLLNIRHYGFVFYPFEIILNTILIIWLICTSRINKNSIFHIHGAANIAPIIVGSLFKIPIIWHFHETVSAFVGLVSLGKLFLAPNNHHLVAVAKKAVEVYQLSEANIIQSPIDIEYWNSNPPFGSNNKVFTIVSVGNINPLKGQDILLESLKDLPGNWELVMIGAKLSTHKKFYNLLLKIAKVIHNANPYCKIRFLNWQNREQIKKQLENSDVFVLPSRSEACPIALLEAMSMGKICIASNVGDVDKIITNSSLGYLVSPEQPKEITKTLKEIINIDSHKLDIIGLNAQKYIKSNFSQALIAKKFIKLYDSFD